MVKGELINLLADSLDTSGVEWAFLREREIVEDNNDLEVDIWCASNDGSDCIESLLEAGWMVRGGRKVSANKRSSTAIRFSHPVGLDYIVELWIGDLRSGSVIYLDERLVKSSLEMNDKKLFVSGVALLFILFNRTLIRGSFTRYLGRAKQAYESLDKADQIAWRSETAKSIARENIDDLEGLFFIKPNGVLVRRIQLKVILGYFKAGRISVRASIRLFISRIARWIASCRNQTITVCFVGTDGSGKSSLANSLVKESSLYAKESAACYFGRSRGNSKVIEVIRDTVLAILDKLTTKDTPVGKTESGVTRGNDSQSDSASTQSGYVKIARNMASVAYLFDYWWRYLVRKKWVYREFDFVFFDRGPIDIALIDGLVQGGALLLLFAPRFNYYVNCYAAPEIILSRKQERSYGEIERQQNLLKKTMRTYEVNQKGISVCTETNMGRMIKDLNALLYVVEAYNEKRLDKEIYSHIHGLILQRLTPNEAVSK